MWILSGSKSENVPDDIFYKSAKFAAFFSKYTIVLLCHVLLIIRTAMIRFCMY